MFDDRRGKWMEQVAALAPRLHERAVEPAAVVALQADAAAFQGWSVRRLQPWHPEQPLALQPGQAVVLDFGEHRVGQLQLTAVADGQPVRLQVRFAEVPAELGDDHATFPGKLGGAWLTPVTMALSPDRPYRHPHRRAFQYLQLELPVDQPPVRLRRLELIEQCAVAAGALAPPKALLSSEQRRLDEVSLRTLRNCMHEVFEDGPKRDRRLWLGDLRLQAQVNYVSFRDFDLVKRCLYLFAGCAYESGIISACVFSKPDWHPGKTEFIPDYSLLFGPTLVDYVQASGDWDTGRDLWPVAMRQLSLIERYFNDDGVFCDPGDVWLFIDWQPELDRQAAEQGVALYALRRLLEVADRLGTEAEVAWMQRQVSRLHAAAREALWDAKAGLMISRPSGQVSWASQVWAVLGGVLSRAESQRALRTVLACEDAVPPGTPYLYHHMLEAMCACGLVDEARQHLGDYWGGMIERGATTFWEVFAPRDEHYSPYGSHLHNSYCHAWSCTPALFLRTDRGVVSSSPVAERQPPSHVELKP